MTKKELNRLIDLRIKEVKKQLYKEIITKITPIIIESVVNSLITENKQSNQNQNQVQPKRKKTKPISKNKIINSLLEQTQNTMSNDDFNDDSKPMSFKDEGSYAPGANMKLNKSFNQQPKQQNLKEEKIPSTMDMLRETMAQGDINEDAGEMQDYTPQHVAVPNINM